MESQLQKSFHFFIDRGIVPKSLFFCWYFENHFCSFDILNLCLAKCRKQVVVNCYEVAYMMIGLGVFHNYSRLVRHLTKPLKSTEPFNSPDPIGFVDFNGQRP